MQDNGCVRYRKDHLLSTLVKSRRGRGQSGATWIELLIATLFLTLMLTAALPGLIQAGLSFQHSETRTLAGLAALSQCEVLLSAAPPEVSSGHDEWIVERGEKVPPLTFERTWTVDETEGGWTVEVRVANGHTPSSRDTVFRLFRGESF